MICSWSAMPILVFQVLRDPDCDWKTFAGSEKIRTPGQDTRATISQHLPCQQHDENHFSY